MVLFGLVSGMEEPGREVFVEGLGVFSSSRNHGSSGLVLSPV